MWMGRRLASSPRSQRHDDPAHAPQPRPQEQLRLQRAGRLELALRRPRPRPPRPAHDPVPLVQDVAVAAEDPGRALPLDPEGARPAGAGPVAEAPQRRAALAGLPQEPREVPDLARDPAHLAAADAQLPHAPQRGEGPHRRRRVDAHHLDLGRPFRPPLASRACPGHHLGGPSLLPLASRACPGWHPEVPSLWLSLAGGRALSGLGVEMMLGGPVRA
mmetsp:Transcript_111076/g.314373  ORF Transcript_111076/g.314373 Transcript_111076/m.314373 type:complete len:217 (+) Transcript_111076:79-729(+)